MHILLVTGDLAKELVEKIVKSAKTIHKITIVALPVKVIALLSTRDIALSLKRRGIKKNDYDLIIVPGLCRGSAKEIEKEIGIPAVKGPIHAYDIPLILEFNNPLEYLSSEEPADKVIERIKFKKNLEILRSLEEKLRKEKTFISIGNVLLPINPPPMRIATEIPDSYRYDYRVIVDKVLKYIGDGAHIIVLGFEPYNPRPDKVYELIKHLKKDIEASIAVDTLSPLEINSSLKAGADLVLSIDYSNVDKVANIIKEYNVPVIAIPYDSSTNYIPVEPMKRIEYLEKLITKIKEYGVENVIGDLILDPPIIGNVLESIYSYKLFKKRNPEIPLMMGVGNVVELYDVDSVGANAILALLALEAGVSLLLLVEKSVKTQGSTRETAIASQMITLASIRKSPPKDLGIDLLILKDKRREEIPFETENAKNIFLDKYDVEYRIDRTGIFKIRVNYREKLIETLYIGVKGKILIKSRSAQSILNYILDKGLVTELSHAMYLGRELGKAEEALRIEKNYVQEKPLFSIKKPLKIIV